MAYQAFTFEDGSTGGSFEVFYVNAREARENSGAFYGPGWYWWACFPGCMPDGEPSGPFDSEAEAIEDANS